MDRVVFVTIVFSGIPEAFDYPKELPIPSKGDEIHFNGKSGIVEKIKHMTHGNVTDICIKCAKI